MTPYNSRQFILMIDKINCYQTGLINLPTLIDDLIGLLNVLENYDQAWECEFRSNWIDLEVIYAYALDENIPYDDLDTKEETFEITKELKRLILTEIGKLTLTED